jgi:trehalose 6-phosphate synthase
VTHVRTYPISIDVEATRRVAGSRGARRRAAQLSATTQERIIVRVDRLEPSKNIVRGFLAYEALLQRHPRLRGRISFLAFLVPSRTGLREYGHYGRQVQDAVDRINARFGRAEWRPVQIFYENDYAQALAGLSIADVVLVNPLVDGMNLVAKEAVIVSERDAVLILSETAGAFDQMADGVLAVAPADVAGTAEALARALTMEPDERRRRLARLRRGVEREDIGWWLRRQLTDLAELTG